MKFRVRSKEKKTCPLRVQYFPLGVAEGLTLYTGNTFFVLPEVKRNAMRLFKECFLFGSNDTYFRNYYFIDVFFFFRPNIQKASVYFLPRFILFRTDSDYWRLLMHIHETPCSFLTLIYDSAYVTEDCCCGNGFHSLLYCSHDTICRRNLTRKPPITDNVSGIQFYRWKKNI